MEQTGLHCWDASDSSVDSERKGCYSVSVHCLPQLWPQRMSVPIDSSSLHYSRIPYSVHVLFTSRTTEHSVSEFLLSPLSEVAHTV